MACTHSAIRPPGRMPNPSTATPFSDITARTLPVLTMGRVSAGSSKYMTLITRR